MLICAESFCSFTLACIKLKENRKVKIINAGLKDLSDSQRKCSWWFMKKENKLKIITYYGLVKFVIEILHTQRRTKDCLWTGNGRTQNHMVLRTTWSSKRPGLLIASQRPIIDKNCASSMQMEFKKFHFLFYFNFMIYLIVDVK